MTENLQNIPSIQLVREVIIWVHFCYCSCFLFQGERKFKNIDHTKIYTPLGCNIRPRIGRKYIMMGKENNRITTFIWYVYTVIVIQMLAVCSGRQKWQYIWLSEKIIFIYQRVAAKRNFSFASSFFILHFFNRLIHFFDVLRQNIFTKSLNIVYHC